MFDFSQEDGVGAPVSLREFASIYQIDLVECPLPSTNHRVSELARKIRVQKARLDAERALGGQGLLGAYVGPGIGIVVTSEGFAKCIAARIHTVLCDWDTGDGLERALTAGRKAHQVLLECLSEKSELDLQLVGDALDEARDAIDAEFGDAIDLGVQEATAELLVLEPQFESLLITYCAQLTECQLRHACGISWTFSSEFPNCWIHDAQLSTERQAYRLLEFLLLHTDGILGCDDPCSSPD